MATIPWPPTLPQRPLVQGYGETLPSALLESAVDSGISKTRRRSTARVRPITAVYRVDATQKATLDDFYRVDVKDGALSFQWPDPDGVTRNARFKAGQPPRFQPRFTDIWNATLQLEILP